MRPKEHELHAAIYHGRGRQPGQFVEIRESLKLLPHRCELLFAQAEVHVEIRKAAHPGGRAVFDQQDLRHVNRAIFPRNEPGRERHIVILQTIGVIGHD
jgi:hypothetical protein